MKKSSIFLKTFIHILLLMIGLVGVIHLAIFLIYNEMYTSEKEESVTSHLDYVSVLIMELDKNSLETALTKYAKNNNINIIVKTSSETQYFQGSEVLIDYERNEDSMLPIKNVADVETTIIKTKELTMNSGEKKQIQVSSNLTPLFESRRIAFSLLPYSLLFSIVIAFCFSYIYSKMLTAPIKQMSKTVNDMTKLKKGITVTVKNKDEIGQLANDINLLYEDLTKTIEDYKEKNEEVLHVERERLDYFRATSHELKTPLAKLSILAENMKYDVGKYKDHKKYLSESIVIINTLSAMISELLEGIKDIKIEKEGVTAVSVQETLLKAIEEYQILAKSKQLYIEKKLDGDFTLNIRPKDLQKVLSNILSNAIKYTKDNGRIEVSLTSKVLIIYNEAEEIPENVLKNIWKGEYTLQSDANKSNGMGLYIVKKLLDKYHIHYNFYQEREGYAFQISKA